MLTMKTRYALKALGILAERGLQQTTLIAEISEREAIPRKFLEAILRELRQHGRSAGGGAVTGCANPRRRSTSQR
jgi:DNA-binding IscR family transcriptional regulator